MSSYEDRPRPAIWGPVLIAAVFLAIIGGSAGWIAGDRVRAADLREAAEQAQDGQQDGQQGGPEVVPDNQPPDPGETGGSDGEQGGNQGGGGQGGDRPRRDRCPAHTRELAGAGELSLRLYLRTNRSHVWICADADGRLFYQGLGGRLGDGFVEGKNALFLTDVRREGNGYVAVNRDTTYRVTSERLVIIHPGGEESVEPAA